VDPKSPLSPAPRPSTNPSTGPSPAPNTLVSAEPELTGPLSPLEQNRRITEGYGRIAQGMQTLLDPDYRPGGASRVLPNWYAFAPHASQQVGRGLLGADISRRLIRASQGGPPLSLAQALAPAGLAGPQLLLLEALLKALSWQGLPYDVAAALVSLQGAMNLEALLDPRTQVITAQRFARLYLSAPGRLPLDKALSVALTLEHCLNEGNVAIFTDIGGSGEAYLAWRQLAGSITPERVLTGFLRPGSRPEEARRAYTYALEHAQDSPRPSDFARALPGVGPGSMVVAAFALYELARLSPGAEMRDALIALANNFIAYREQFETVQPAFTPDVCREDEVSRAELMQALTPLISLRFQHVEWKFTDYSGTQRDRDGTLLTSKATEYSWATFPDRWPAILQAFEWGYQHRNLLWTFPPPLVGPDGQLTGRG
jgi:hypothetical protein